METDPHETASTREGVLDAATMRAQHRRLLLNLLWNEREASRADLARRSGLSRSTVSAIVGDLLETGVVREARTGTSTGGRRPIVLELVADSALLVGVELGASHVTVVLTDLYGVVLGHREVPCPVRDDPECALNLVEDCIGGLLEARPGARERIVGIGVAAPSPIDPRAPGRFVASILPKWADYDVAERLRQRFGRPVLVDNDANLGALAELWWGGRCENLVYLKVATGIGAGLILDGRILRGARGVAGEVGHTTIDPHGPLCMCGLRGCLNTLVGTHRLFESVRELRQDHPSSPLQTEPLTVDRLVDAALEGDELARSVIATAGRTLGIGVANLLNLVNPERLVIGGGITRAGELLLEPLRHTVRTRTLAESIAHAEIERSPLGELGIAVGAATLVLERALAEPSMFDVVKEGART
jgi:predicted NBD/HSP70 family sugar kinase